MAYASPKSCSFEVYNQFSSRASRFIDLHSLHKITCRCNLCEARHSDHRILAFGTWLSGTLVSGLILGSVSEIQKANNRLQTGQVQRADELPEGDIRKPFPRIQPGNFEKNMELANEVGRIAKRKKCSIGQLALAWVRHHSGRPDFPGVLPIPGATTPARVEENMQLSS